MFLGFLIAIIQQSFRKKRIPSVRRIFFASRFRLFFAFRATSFQKVQFFSGNLGNSFFERTIQKTSGGIIYFSVARGPPKLLFCDVIIELFRAVFWGPRAAPKNKGDSHLDTHLDFWGDGRGGGG